MLSRIVSRSLRSSNVSRHLVRSTAASSILRATHTRSFKTSTVLKRSDMFCFQCEQTNEQKGCTTVGVCGKTPEVANLQDLLVHAVKGIAVVANQFRIENSKEDLSVEGRFVMSSLFATMTNVNFDASRMYALLKEASQIRADLIARYRAFSESRGRKPKFFNNDAVQVNLDISNEALLQLSMQYGVEARQEQFGEDYVGLTEMTVYGLKGMCAYMEHAAILGQIDAGIQHEVNNLLSMTTRTDLTVPELLAMALKVGELNLQVMGMMDKGHNELFGTPEPSSVPHYPVRPSKCLLVSGHDMVDLEHILKQTEGKNIDVYTHGEMLPAHSYPGLDKYEHLIGHYGTAWQNQKFEFAAFPGSIVMTTNCIIEPMKSYAKRIFTRSVVGYPNVTHIGENNDFSPAIEAALADVGFTKEDVPQESARKSLTIGFGHNAILSNAGAIVDAVTAGKISHFFLIGGCDGSEGERSYFTDVAKASPKDSIILTLGCGKYRINELELGEVAGFPRVLDMGQCNDSYGAVQVAVALANAFKTDVNGLPLSFCLSWFEQKAVAVLLTCLHLGIRDIKLGPHLPAFATPNIVNALVENFNISPIGDAEADMVAFLKK